MLISSHLRKQYYAFTKFHLVLWASLVDQMVKNLPVMRERAPYAALNNLYTCKLLNGLPWYLSGKDSACTEENQGSVPGWGRSSVGGHGNSLQHSCLGNPMDFL